MKRRFIYSLSSYIVILNNIIILIQWNKLNIFRHFRDGRKTAYKTASVNMIWMVHRIDFYYILQLTPNVIFIRSSGTLMHVINILILLSKIVLF